ncbi:hypothetical protein O3P69_014489 [Scylla paramamosain]|uniref:Protein quiver n=1 Tax=Scylla paramamosain TaxID=85552 RepID=A0AAW0TBC4_SCYPA
MKGATASPVFTMSSTLVLCCIAACLALTEGVHNDLSCYQCNVTHSDECTDDYLAPCPDTQLFDRCQTRDRRTADGRHWVEKGCALAPCQLPRMVGDALGTTCDYSAPAYDCVFCCRGSGCNGRAVSTVSLPPLLLRLLLPLLGLLTPVFVL